MNPATPSTTPTESEATESEVTEKQPWTPPILKKMDIEETAINDLQFSDGDGAS